MLDPAGVEHQREVSVRQLGAGQARPGKKACLARAGGEGNGRCLALRIAQQGLADTVVAITQRAAIVLTPGFTRPLLRRLTQSGIADAAHIIAGGRVPGLAQLVEHRFSIGVAERLGIAHGAGDTGNDLPVGQARARRLDGLVHQGQVALGIDHHPLALSPQRGGQENIGVAVSLGVEEGILGDHQFRRLQTFDHLLAVGDAGHRVAADDPASLDLPGSEVFEQRHRAVTGFAAQAAGGDLPQLLDEGAIRRDQRRALPWQARAHVAHFAPAHGIGLAGQRERSAARPANGAGGQVQVAQGVALPGAMDALVQAHGPAAHPLRGLADPVGGLADIGFAQPGDSSDPLGCVVL
ncbi:hypothetical protein D9M71_353860 [compost metagenome]